MRRRDFLSVVAGAMAWPITAGAQQPAMPVVCFLAVTAGSADDAPNVAALLKGLAELGYVEGKNVALEYRWANFKPELLPQLASDLVRSKVNIIFAATPARLPQSGTLQPAFLLLQLIWRVILLPRDMLRA